MSTDPQPWRFERRWVWNYDFSDGFGGTWSLTGGTTVTSIVLPAPPSNSLAACDQQTRSDAMPVGIVEVAKIGTFAHFYDSHVNFVHRGARRLGIDESAVEDVVQDVFLVVHRRLPEFRNASSIRTWLYGILLRVARLHRRTVVRSNLHGAIDRNSSIDPEDVTDVVTRRPDAAAETMDAYRTLLRILDHLDDDKREMFVLAELEQLPIIEIAELLGLKPNTAYSRLRLARAAFESARIRIARPA